MAGDLLTRTRCALGFSPGQCRSPLLPVRRHRRRRRRALPKGDDDDPATAARRASQSRADVADQNPRAEPVTQLRQVDASRFVAAVAVRAVHDQLDRFGEPQLLLLLSSRKAYCLYYYTGCQERAAPGARIGHSCEADRSSFRRARRNGQSAPVAGQSAPMQVSPLSAADVDKLFGRSEGHFVDFKSTAIQPAKLTRSISAFANADGGELFVGIDEPSSGGPKTWAGFKSVESANGLIQAIESVLPLGQGCRITFLSTDAHGGLVLQIEVFKNRDIIKTTAGEVYIRRGAQNLPVIDPETLERLRLNKGLASFETATVDAPDDAITNSEETIRFMLEIVPHQEPAKWLRKQNLIVQEKPTVAGVVLFADEPQALLPKRCGIKIYRYRTKEDEGTRETLDGIPATVEGCAYRQVYAAVSATKGIIEGIRRMTAQGLAPVEYPEETLHEIITNAVLHRDYSIPDDIHIRIYDNRVEVESPGSLPGHITPTNILDERFARNGNLVRVINKFPNPPNKDVGEGLNTAFRAMHRLHLKEPEIVQKASSVLVVIRHEQLASPEERIMAFLDSHETISNGEARDICVIREDWRVRSIFARMVEAGMIEKVPGSTTSNTAYRKKP